MSIERIIIHLPAHATATEDIYNHVVSASQAENRTSPQTLQLHQQLTNILAPYELSVDLTGTDCIVISDYNKYIAQIISFISPLLSHFSTLTVLENKQLVWTFGDENTAFRTETSEYQAPWASLRCLPSRIDLITANARTLASLNLGTDPRDFLIISDNTKIEHYIQCYFSPADNNYRVEMRLGDAQHHYWCIKDDAPSVVQELITWMNTTDHSPHGWHKLDIS